MIKLPKKIGRSFPYFTAAVSIFRTRIPVADLKTGKVKKYPREYMMTVKPLLFKEKTEAKGFCKQFAFANREAGMYDWEFAIDWLGVENVKAVEKADRANNGHPCPRCNRMTLQGGEKDLCEGCSTAKA